MKISIVTPSFNSVRFIRQTINSVITQCGEFSIEYIIVDNESSDGTKEVIKEFQRLLRSSEFVSGCNTVELIYISQHDSGMYDAINKGFEAATGDIYAWLNSDDIYLPGAFATIVNVFSKYTDIHWLKGITSYITGDATTIWRAGRCLLYAQSWIRDGVYGRDHYFIQQDSVFWRAHMWDRAGGIDATLKLAGDYYLWAKFAEYSPLVSVNALISCFRTVDGQLSQDLRAYTLEMKSLLPGNNTLSTRTRLFLQSERWVPRFISKYIYRLLYSHETFHLIMINAKGEIKNITGQYFDVLRYISRN